MSKYDHHDKETLIRLLERRDAQRQLGLVWEREDDEVRDRAINDDFVALALDEGDGFFPDFVVSLTERKQADGVALLEVKGNQWWGVSHEVEKATAKHVDYGDVFMVGRERGHRDFIHLRKLGDKLESAGAFDIARMRW